MRKREIMITITAVLTFLLTFLLVHFLIPALSAADQTTPVVFDGADPETPVIPLRRSVAAAEPPDTEAPDTEPVTETTVQGDPAEAASVATPQEEPEIVWTDMDEVYAIFVAKTLWGECRGCAPMEQAAVVWCVLNRVDSTDPWLPDDIVAVITQPRQFAGYSPDNPVTDDLLNMARDVLRRWYAEKLGVKDVGRVLPREYLSFHGDEKKQHNLFTVDGSGAYWGWSLPDPYVKKGDADK